MFDLLTYHRFQCYLLPVFHRSAFKVILAIKTGTEEVSILTVCYNGWLEDLEWGLGTKWSGLLSLFSIFISVLFPFLCWCWNNDIIHFQQVDPTFDVPDKQAPDPAVINIRPVSGISTPVSCFKIIQRKKRKTVHMNEIDFLAIVECSEFNILNSQLKPSVTVPKSNQKMVW